MVSDERALAVRQRFSTLSCRRAWVYYEKCTPANALSSETHFILGFGFALKEQPETENRNFFNGLPLIQRRETDSRG